MNPLGGSLTQTGRYPGRQRVVLLAGETNPTLPLIVLPPGLHRGLVVDHVGVLVVSQVVHGLTAGQVINSLAAGRLNVAVRDLVLQVGVGSLLQVVIAEGGGSVSLSMDTSQ